jgi:hypothetical protein
MIGENNQMLNQTLTGYRIKIESYEKIILMKELTTNLRKLFQIEK